MDKSFWRGTLILTVSAFVIKILSALYRLPYQNLAGDVGFYVYQQVYPFYALASVMGGFGFPVVLSKIIAENQNKNDGKRQSVLKTASITLGGLGILLFLILFFGAPSIADIMGDHRLKATIQLISFIFLFMPPLAALRGYFQGAFYNMLPTGVSQVTEQTVRVAVILGLSLFLFSTGAGPYAFGSAAAFGSMIAPAFSVVVLLLFYFKWSKRSGRKSAGKWDRSVAKRLLIEGTAYTLTALSLVFFQLSDVLTLVPMLEEHHMSAGRELKGIYDRSYPLIQMGMTAAVALSTAIIPMVAKLRDAKEQNELKSNIKQAMRMAILFGGAASVGLFSIIKETNIMLFENSEGTTALAIMVFCILAASVTITGASILQGMGYIFRPVVYLAAAFIVKTALNFFLVPDFGIVGAAVATFIGIFTLAISIFLKISEGKQLSIFTIKEWTRLAAVFIVLYVGVFLWRFILSYGLSLSGEGRIEAAFVAMTSVILGAMIFLVLILKSGLLSWKEIEQLPGGARFSAIFHRKKLR